MTCLHRAFLFVAVLSLTWTGAAEAQNSKGKQAELEASRNNPVIVKAFRDVVKKPSEYTVRVLAGEKEVALGTIVGADGWILTKWSEVRERENLTCKFKDGKVLKAQLVNFKDDNAGAYDLAMLRVKATGLPTVEWRPSSSATAGRWVASPGLGEDPVAIGVVGVGTRPHKDGDQFPKTFDNSGYLGVELDDAMGEGAKITKVSDFSPAFRANLKKDDIIFELAGQTIEDVKSLQSTLQMFKAGEKVVLKIRRSEKELDMPVTLGKRPVGNKQDYMGSKLSNRRGGFPFILQHDTVLDPKDCGGPLVDLDGKTVGINIARAGRTETYAIPSEKVIPLLTYLKSPKADANQILHVISSLDAADKQDKRRPGRLIKAHEVKLTAGTTYLIELDSSEFDAYLVLEDAAGKKLAEDDDSGGNSNAKIVFTPSTDGAYRVVATSFEANQKGSYTLTVRKQDGPKKDKN
jgi:serine protease Do